MSDVETACMKRYIQLQLGTVIYLVTFVDRLPGVWRSTIKPGGYNTTYFIYDYSDGLWATEWAREIWEKHPHCHPHASLFTLLYKKLELEIS
jgi:hypothetical protein